MFGASANEIVAIFTIILALVGASQLGVYGYQARKLRQSLELSERAIRPYVFLETVSGYVFPDAIGERLQKRGAGAVALDELPAVKYTIVNKGKSPAIIKEISTALVTFDTGIPKTPNYRLCRSRPG
jgi:hypothetical protein